MDLKVLREWVGGHQNFSTLMSFRLGVVCDVRRFCSHFSWCVQFLYVIVSFTDVRPDRAAVGAGANAGGYFRPLNSFIELGVPC